MFGLARRQLLSQRVLLARRWASKASKTEAPVVPSTAAADASRIARVESRIPRFLRGYLTPLREAPVSHISAFLILHELTAVVPLFGLTAIFHYTNWLPPYISEGAWVSGGVQMFGSWLRKRGWIDETNVQGRWFGRGEKSVRIVVELATAYAITKAFLPLRLIVSVWGTPWFARWTVLPVTNRIKGLFGKKKVVTAVPGSAPAAGTGATAGSAVPRTK